MASRIDGKGVLWALFFVIVLFAVYEILTPGSSVLDLFSRPETNQTRLEQAIDRATKRGM
ncbi:MAG: hypothetical protein VX815_00855 [Gemmatimonadota bacterium]|jgi:hypothetical protein|nr:hypothetical protein [Gemmatimonadota bacterium]